MTPIVWEQQRFATEKRHQIARVDVDTSAGPDSATLTVALMSDDEVVLELLVEPERRWAVVGGSEAARAAADRSSRSFLGGGPGPKFPARPSQGNPFLSAVLGNYGWLIGALVASACLSLCYCCKPSCCVRAAGSDTGCGRCLAALHSKVLGLLEQPEEDAELQRQLAEQELQQAKPLRDWRDDEENEGQGEDEETKSNPEE